jgi:hypothetical protein
MRIRPVLQIALGAVLLMPLTEVPGKADGPPYKVTRNVVERSISVTDYRLRAGTTKLDFRPTALLPRAHGDIEVKDRQGRTEIEMKLEGLTPGTVLGPEYLTYVLWAVTADGRTINLSEVVPNENNKFELVIAVDLLPAFGLIMTAEPYFAVTQPSNFVAAEIVSLPDEACFRNNTVVNYLMLERGQYYANVPAREVTTIYSDRIEPLELSEARNALRIAWWSNAASYAPASYAEAKNLLHQAEVSVDKFSEPTAITAQEAVQAAEIATSKAVRCQAVIPEILVDCNCPCDCPCDVK